MVLGQRLELTLRELVQRVSSFNESTTASADECSSNGAGPRAFSACERSTAHVAVQAEGRKLSPINPGFLPNFGDGATVQRSVFAKLGAFNGPAGCRALFQVEQVALCVGLGLGP